MTARLFQHPERLAMALVVMAWAVMLGQAAAAHRFACCSPHPSTLEDTLSWTGMVIAMMVPTTYALMRDISFRSYRSRRIRAVFGYLFGYLAWWVALGVPIVVLRRLGLAHDIRLATALCVFAAGWALVPARERWHRHCHRRIALSPLGWRADRDAFRQGATNGSPCVAMCWPLMVACTITGHNLVLMAGSAALALFEKRMFWLKRRPLVLGALLLAAWTLAL